MDPDSSSSFAANDVIILSGGRGERLGSLVDDTPKPMLPVMGRPFLEWMLLHLRSLGFESFILSVGYRRQAVVSHFGDGRAWGVCVRYCGEERPLGTAGALKKALGEAATADVIVMNGDSLCLCDVGDFFRFHRSRGGELTMCCVRVPDASRYGSVEADDGGSIVGFREKQPGAGWINAGMYWVKKSFVKHIGDASPLSLEREVLPAARGLSLKAYRAEADFIDVGTPASLSGAAEFIRRNGLSSLAEEKDA